MEESCAIIYRDGRYRSEKFFVRRGDADSMRANTDASRITEGQLTDAALASLEKILDAQELRDLKPPSMVRHLADEDLDALSVTVARQQGQLQQLNYPTRASRKGAARTLKPLLEWWQDLRKQLVQPVSSLQRTRCLPQSSW
jgi:hypothetical protein